MKTSIEQLRALKEKATGGPWFELDSNGNYTKSPASEYIVAAVNALPEILSELEALRAFHDKTVGWDVEGLCRDNDAYRAFVEEVKGMDMVNVWINTPDNCLEWEKERDAALARLSAKLEGEGK